MGLKSQIICAFLGLIPVNSFAAFHLTLKPESGFQLESYTGNISSGPMTGMYLGIGTDCGYRSPSSNFASVLSLDYNAGNGDNYSESNLLFGLGIKALNLWFRGGIIQSMAKSTDPNNSFSFNGAGTWVGLAYTIKFWKSFMFEMGARFTNVAFKSSGGATPSTTSSTFSSTTFDNRYVLYFALPLQLGGESAR
jgi:hypothetical protein